MGVTIDIECEVVRKVVVSDLIESINCIEQLRTSSIWDKESKKDLKALRRVLRFYSTKEERDELRTKSI